MAEETTTADPQAGEAAPIQPPAQAATTSTPEPQAGDGAETISLEEARKLRSEAANLRKRLKAFEDAENKAKEAQMTEQDRLKKQLADLQTLHNEQTQATFERIVNLEIRAQAASLGINPKHLDKIARFIEWEGIEPDADGNPTGIKEAVEKLLKDMPELLGKGSALSAPTGGGTTNPARSTSTAPQALSWEVIGKMTSTEYDARRAEIQAWIMKNPHRYGRPTR